VRLKNLLQYLNNDKYTFLQICDAVFLGAIFENLTIHCSNKNGKIEFEKSKQLESKIVPDVLRKETGVKYFYLNDHFLAKK